MSQSGANSKLIPFPRDPRKRQESGKRGLEPASSPRPPGNLPVLMTPFIGRHEQLDALCSLLLDESVRLLVLTGPGGIGKTRLALQVAEEVVPNFEDGAYFVALAPVSSPDLVIPTIAQTLGVKEEGGASIADRLRDHLSDKGLLLILDNFEQVAGAAPQVAALLAGAPGVRVIVTTRVSLHLYGEFEYPVPPMALPETLEDVSGSAQTLEPYEAIQLFVARAQEAGASFRLTDANAKAIGQICRRLDGLPLALELAAARTRLFSPQALVTRLGRSLRLLTSGPVDAPTRHRTLRNAIAWSYNLLDEVEQKLFARLGVFAGGCTLDAIAHVASHLGLNEGELIDKLESLIDKSLLEQREQLDGEPRFWMLETIREYALETLGENGQNKQAQEAHAIFFLALAEKAKPHMRDSQQAAWHEALELEQDNFRAAITFLAEQPDRTLAVRLVGALGWFWYVRGYLTEGSRWLELVLSPQTEQDDTGSGEEEIAWWAEAYRGAGALAFMQSHYTRAIAFTKQGLEMARKLSDKGQMARALNNLSTILNQVGDIKQARPFLEESLALKQRLGDRVGTAHTLTNLALNNAQMGNYEGAHNLINEVIAILRELKDNTGLATAIYLRGRIALREGKIEGALESLNESLSLARKISFKTCELTALSEIGLTLCEKGDDAAQGVLGEALQMAKQLGDLSEESWIKLGLGKVALRRGEHEQARELMQEALRLRVQLGEYNTSTLETLEWLADAEAEIGRQGNKESARRAAILLGAEVARREAMGTPVPPIWRDQHTQTNTLTRTLLGSQAFAAAWSRGRAMPVTEAIALAIQEGYEEESGTTAVAQPVQAAEEAAHEMTSREIQVLRLIAAGLTNKEIGERLVLSHRTVEAHLYSIFNKLNVTTRSAATRYAVEQSLV